VRKSFWPAAQAALAAALAWLVAHRALGHAQPFFAPIAAAIALSTSHLKRSPRIAQMLIGVLLGIGVAEVLSALIGTSTLALGLVVLVTMLVAVLLGAGFIGQGTMFVNQSVASAILVLTLRGHGVGSERALDALVGAVVALVVGVILFPADPLPRLKQAERAVLRSLASAAEQVADLWRTGRGAQPGWALAIGHEIHEQLSILAQARMTAKGQRPNRSAAVAPATHHRGRGSAHRPLARARRRNPEPGWGGDRRKSRGRTRRGAAASPGRVIHTGARGVGGRSGGRSRCSAKRWTSPATDSPVQPESDPPAQPGPAQAASGGA
jgi:uncharacterized membrane protein YccC